MHLATSCCGAGPFTCIPCHLLTLGAGTHHYTDVQEGFNGEVICVFSAAREGFLIP